MAHRYTPKDHPIRVSSVVKQNASSFQNAELFPFIERHPVSLSRTEANLTRSGNFLIRVVQVFLPVGKPSGGSRNGEQDGEEVHRESHGLIDQSRIEVNIGIQLTLHEVFIFQSNSLQFQSEIKLRVFS